MTTPSLEEQEKIQTTQKSEQPAAKKPADKRKVIGAGVLLAASVALALFQVPQLIQQDRALGGGEGGFFSRLESKKADAPPAAYDLSLQEAQTSVATDESRSRANQVPASAPAAEAGGSLDRDKAAMSDVLPELAKEKSVVAPGRVAAPPPLGADLGHGYNAPGYLIKTATLQVEVGDIQQSFAHIAALTEKYQGFVVDSNLSNYENSQPGAHISLKLPSARLSAALAEIDALGTVRNKQIKTEDLWLQIKKQQLEVERLQGHARATKPGTSQREQQYQIKAEQLERQRLEQMLKMATVTLSLSERAPFWDLRPLGEELRHKSYASMQATTRLVADVLLFVPPLLIFLGLAWLGWQLLRHVLITRLGLMTQRTLGSVYMLALVFFPLYAAGSRGLGAATLFGLFLAALWSGRTIVSWVKAKMAARAAVVAPEGTV